MKNPDRFCVISIVVRWGYVLPWLTALILLGLCFYRSYVQDSLSWVLLALPIAVLAGGAVRLVVEIVDLVAETLLPR